MQEMFARLVEQLKETEGVAIEYVSCEPAGNLKELFPERYGVCDDSFEKEETEQV